MTTRVGFFPHNNSLFVLRHRGLLEQKLDDVAWVDLRELSHGPKVGVRDGLPTAHADHLFTAEGYDVIGTGFTPPITGLGQGHDLVYLGISRPRVENGRLVTRAESGIASVEDLRGKRVGIGHGSWQTTLLLFALDQVGLTWDDIEPVDLGGHAADAFLSGAIDAWTGSYPELAAVEQQTEVLTLVETEGLFSHPSLWFTRRDFAVERTEELKAVIEALQESDARIVADPREAAAYFVADAQAHGQTASLEAWEHALATRPFGIHPVDEEFLDEQQRAADLLFANGLLPRAVDVRSAVLPQVNALVEATRAADARS
ncbi:ABC transporter substrate-binding protein [Mumia zhuanghuii]|jgi:sulfonate transport system substrate-binding protein|uniref:ABC transporter substrate-binding protein n=1 Tax=Mumia zhuanghuii TaxID=2585211 RepID=A0A5C4MVY2_9ACTN|nr:ABC transporter substrate-binding protein [Mumia zhuanghuii]TNC31857.1 ABC transporter substrate-binding protein [Mumia zhuanghuii]TNC49524.1 ABC transporter substrate-binding protein [Mumia zhuanghuii]